MIHLPLLVTLAGSLTFALVLGLLTQRVGLSPIVGYLLAGIAVGTKTPGFVADQGLAGQLAEIGVILLMFGVGLKFHLADLLAVRRVAVPGALAQLPISAGLGAWAAHSWGFDLPACVVFGLAVCVASTVVLVRVLSDRHDLHTPVGRVAMGWLVVEDLFTVLALVILPALFARGNDSSQAMLTTVAFAVLKLVVLVVVALVFGQRLLPRLLGYVAASRSRELFTLAVLASALGIAVASAELFGASLALGAFLAGMIVGQSEFAARAASEALPMRDAFAVLFFVSVGMLFDPSHLVHAPFQVLTTLAIIVLAKPIAVLSIVLALRRPLGLALPLAAAIGQMGEFSFMVATVSRDLGIFPAAGVSTLVAASIGSITLNPFLYRLARRWTKTAGPAAAPASPRKGGLRSLDLAVESSEHSAIVVGFGPVGQTVARILDENGVSPIIVDLNLETIRGLHAKGTRAVYGDATSTEVLESAGVRTAVALFLTASGVEHAREVVSRAREANAEMGIFVRSEYVTSVSPLLQAGADAVISAEEELAWAMAERLLRSLGATAEQIDRERDRVHEEVSRSAKRGLTSATKRHEKPA